MLFHLPVTLLLICCAGIWTGARCWLLLVPRQLRRSAAETQLPQGQVRQNGEQRLFILWLLLLFVNSIAPLVQALQLTTFWLIAEIAIVAASGLEIAGIVGITAKLPSRLCHIALLLASGLLALIAFLTVLLPGYFSVSNGDANFAVLLVRMLLFITGMTVGSMLAFTSIYVPVVRQLTPVEKARPLLKIAPYYSQIIISGEILIAIAVLLEVLQARNSSVSFVSATMISYSQSLALEIVLLCILLIVSTIHLKIAFPQLRKALGKYTYISQRVKAAGTAKGNLLEQLKQREARLVARTQFLRTIARCEAATGMCLLLVVSLAYAILSAAPLPVPATQQLGIQKPSSQFTATTLTTDNQFKLTLIVSPNHYGPNAFTVSIDENRTGSPTTLVDVSLSLTMMDMNMGTDILRLRSNGSNRYSGTGNLSMTGNWAVRIFIRTQDNSVHEAQIKLLTPY